MIQKSHFYVFTQEKWKPVHLKTCMRMFIEALLKIVKNCKQSKCLSIGERIHKTMDYIHTMENYSPIKKELITDISNNTNASQMYCAK